MNGVRVSELIAPTFYAAHRSMARREFKEYWLQGGRGSTKSSFAATELILAMLRDPRLNAIVFRRVKDTLRDSVYAEIKRVILRMRLEGCFEFRLSPMEIRLMRTGQSILFRGADKPEKSKSIALENGYFGFLWLEELAEFESMDSVRTIRASIMRGIPEGARCTTIYSYNPPKTSACWVNKEALKIKSGRLIHKSSYLDVPKDWLGQDFIDEAEALRAENERAYRHMYLGEVTGSGGNVFENLELREIAPDEIDSFGAFYQGIDWGWFPDPFHWVRTAFDAARRTLYILDEYRTVKAGNKETYDAIEDRLRDDELLTADSAEKKSIADYREFGAWWIRGAVKGPGSVDYSVKWLAALKKIVIDPVRCPRAAEEFSAYEYEKNAQGEFIAGYPDADNHAIDAVRYALSPVWRRKGE